MSEFDSRLDSASGGAPALEARTLEFGYGPTTFLKINELTVRRGELVGILGPNGAGKSTCLRLLAGLLTPKAGTVQICGQSVEKLSPSERARLIAWVPQRSETPFEWSVREMVSMGRHPYRGARLADRAADREAVRRALEKVGLASLAERRIGTLSGGEWQRALIARTLAQEAKVLLLDEPVASLDLGYQRQIYELVRDMCRVEGLAAFAADHHVDLQAIFCDRLILMDGGRFRSEGTPAEVLLPETLEPVYRTPLTVVRDMETGRPAVRWKFRKG